MGEWMDRASQLVIWGRGAKGALTFIFLLLALRGGEANLFADLAL